MEMAELKKIWQILCSYDPAIWGAMVSASIAFIIEIFLCKKGLIFSSTSKKIDRARKAGHVVQGKRVRCRYEEREEECSVSNRIYVAYYEYEIEGKRGEKKQVIRGIKPPMYIYLYYENSSQKLFSEYDASKNPVQIILYIIPIIIAYYVAKFMGYPI